jgi:hypothetical protein
VSHSIQCQILSDHWKKLRAQKALLTHRRRIFSEKNNRATNRQDGIYIKLSQAVYRKHGSEPVGYIRAEVLLVSENL